VEGEHVGLDGDVGVLPGVEGVDGHVARLGGRRDHVELLALGVADGALLGYGFGSGGGRRGCGVAAGEGEAEEREGE